MFTDKDLEDFKNKLLNKKEYSKKIKDYLLNSNIPLKDKFIIALANLSTQMYGPLLEKIVIKELGLKKISSTKNIGDCYNENTGKYYEIKCGLVSNNQIYLFQVRPYQNVDYISAHYEPKTDSLVFMLIKKEDMNNLCNDISSSSHGSGNFKNEEKQIAVSIDSNTFIENNLTFEELKEYVG